MNFEFLCSNKIVVGEGSFASLPTLLPSANNILFVTNIEGFFESKYYTDVYHALVAENKTVFAAPVVAGEPEVAGVNSITALAKLHEVDVIVGVGGGSALDSAKAACALATNPGSVRDYLEIVGDKQLLNQPLPFVAVPTTAGTGSEVTKNAVITSKEDNKKVSLRHEMLLSRLVVIDPTLAVSAPKHVTAYSGMDAVCQLIESYITKKPNPITDALCLHHIPIALESLKRVYDCPEDIKAREQMAVAALCSGLTLANAGLGMAHGIAAGLGAVYGMPHGKACAILLPYALRFNHAHGVERIEVLSQKIYGQGAQKLIDELFALNDYLGIPKGLKELNVDKAHYGQLIPGCMGSSMQKNPVEVTSEQLEELLDELRVI